MLLVGWVSLVMQVSAFVKNIVLHQYGLTPCAGCEDSEAMYFWNWHLKWKRLVLSIETMVLSEP